MAKLKTLPARVGVMSVQLKTLSPESWRATKQSSTQRGYGYKWQQYRLAYLSKHPLCVYCQARGRVTEATVVDHIQPHRGDQGLFWDKDNHQSLCRPCHDSVKQREEKRLPAN